MLLLRISKILILFFYITNSSLASEISIKTRVDNEIVTNVDIDKEKKYLILLNPKLKNLSEKDLNKIAKNSLIKEIIKTKELKKIFDINKEYKFVEKIEKNLLIRKNIKNKNDFINYLNLYELNYESVKQKLKIEALWNQLVYKKYFKNVKIDKSSLKQKVIKRQKNIKVKYEYNLSEIVFEENFDENKKNTINKINNSIKKVGFENTANIYSISDTSKNGGLIGWINEIQIAEKIRSKIEDLQINDTTEPIRIPNGYIILKLNNKKKYNQNFDIEKELNKMVDRETNKQLSNFSIIFYKRLKQNAVINDEY